jgi:protein-S-isoprenylcysteine O-methyltransferase Ste14
VRAGFEDRRSRAAVGSIVFLVIAPGLVAGLVPWLLTGWEADAELGDLTVLRAFGGFLLAGGTPAPVAPTERLVVGGLYRHVRNPMYLAVEAAILGQALLLGRIVLVAYAALIGAVFWAFVRLYEEPTLARRYGAEYDAYRRAVPAWWPRLRPWHPSRNVRDWTAQ